MYQKPQLVQYGTLRELTLIGFGADGDGGLFGLGIANGCFIGCNNNNNRS